MCLFWGIFKITLKNAAIYYIYEHYTAAQYTVHKYFLVFYFYITCLFKGSQHWQHFRSVSFIFIFLFKKTSFPEPKINQSLHLFYFTTRIFINWNKDLSCSISNWSSVNMQSAAPLLMWTSCLLMQVGGGFQPSTPRLLLFDSRSLCEEELVSGRDPTQRKKGEGAKRDEPDVCF